MDSTNQKSKAKYSVLIVDDYFLIRHNHKLLLEKVGFQVYEAIHGQDGMNKIDEYGPEAISLIIVDLMMPVMSGAEFIMKGNEIYGDRFPPVLVCSSASDLPLVKKIAAMGIAGYLVKPVDYKALIKKLHEMFPDMDE